MDEIWKKIDWIPNLRGTYEVSNLGNVRRTSLIWHNYRTGECKTVFKTRYLKLYDNGHGYLHVALPINTEKGKKIKSLYVHVLVAVAFIENLQNKPEVNHKNFIRTDNRVTNLEWCTSKENMEHSSSMDRRLKPHYPSSGSKYENKAKPIEEKPILEERPKKRRKHKAEQNISFQNNRYVARIVYDHKRIYVGCFKTFEDAVKAKTEKLKELGLWDEK